MENRNLQRITTTIITTLVVIVLAVIAIVVINKTGNKETSKSNLVYGAIGGGKENFMSDEDVKKILKDKYNIELVGDTWSNGKTVTKELVREDGTKYDFVFFSDQRYYEEYQTPAEGEEAERYQKTNGLIALNTPIVMYSWDGVVDALVKEGIVTERDGVYYMSDFNKLLGYIGEGKKWSDIGLSDIYGNINIGSTNPVTSSPGATYYGLLASVIYGRDINTGDISNVLEELGKFYLDSGFMGNTPADLFDSYLRMGMGARPIIVDYEKSLIDFAKSNPNEFSSIKDNIRIIYPVPTCWNSHCVLSFTENGDKFVEAMNDPEIQKIAFDKYGFRAGLSSTSYNVSDLGIGGIPQQINSVVPSLRMESYNKIVEKIKSMQ